MCVTLGLRLTIMGWSYSVLVMPSVWSVTKLVSEPKFSYGLQNRVSFGGISSMVMNSGITIVEI